MEPHHANAARKLAFGFLAFCASWARAAGDGFDQFVGCTDKEHKALSQELPGETIDPFTGTLRLVQADLVLPGKAGLDLKIVRSYNSKIWERSDLLDMEPLLAEKEHSVCGYGWSFYRGGLNGAAIDGLLAGRSTPVPCSAGNQFASERGGGATEPRFISFAPFVDRLRDDEMEDTRGAE